MTTNLRKSINEKDKGFTLIELLVVIIIIGILAAIAIPVFLNQRKKGVDASIKADIKNAATAAESLSTDNPGTSVTLDLAAIQAAGTDFKKSPGNTIKIVGTTTTGYCISGYNTGASDAYKSATAAMKYTSAAGGFVAPGGECTTATG